MQQQQAKQRTPHDVWRKQRSRTRLPHSRHPTLRQHCHTPTHRRARTGCSASKPTAHRPRATAHVHATGRRAAPSRWWPTLRPTEPARRRRAAGHPTPGRPLLAVETETRRPGWPTWELLPLWRPASRAKGIGAVGAAEGAWRWAAGVPTSRWHTVGRTGRRRRCVGGGWWRAAGSTAACAATAACTTANSAVGGATIIWTAVIGAAVRVSG